MNANVVLASNRGPVSFVAGEGKYTTKRGAGGLAGALDPVARRLGRRATWVAAAISEGDRAALADGAVDAVGDELGYNLKLLNIEPSTYSAYYNVASNRMLWFAAHDLWEEVGIATLGVAEEHAWSGAYEPVNEMFAAAVDGVCDDDTLVLLQDYHLALTAGLLRALRPRQPIAHFTHCAWGGPRGFEMLPGLIARRVVEGMLGADLIGFHTAAWANGFLDCCERVEAQVDRESGTVHFQGRTSWVRAYPIPIDAGALDRAAARPQVERWVDSFDRDRARRLVVRADRSEPSKNIVRGFHAFGRLLEMRPDLYGRVKFVACLYPSRESMTEYRLYERQVKDAVEGVNARHPGAVELFLNDDFDRTLGALTAYDVLIVNPIRDGMNLVAKEGAGINRRDGALVLSTGAGSFEELGEAAVPIFDPLDVAETAAALERALDMEEGDRRQRAERLRVLARARTPEDWITEQMEDLDRVLRGDAPATPPPEPRPRPPVR